MVSFYLPAPRRNIEINRIDPYLGTSKYSPLTWPSCYYSISRQVLPNDVVLPTWTSFFGLGRTIIFACLLTVWLIDCSWGNKAALFHAFTKAVINGVGCHYRQTSGRNHSSRNPSPARDLTTTATEGRRT